LKTGLVYNFFKRAKLANPLYKSKEERDSKMHFEGTNGIQPKNVVRPFWVQFILWNDMSPVLF